jgi:hypothetical protein
MQVDARSASACWRWRAVPLLSNMCDTGCYTNRSVSASCQLDRCTHHRCRKLADNNGCRLQAESCSTGRGASTPLAASSSATAPSPQPTASRLPSAGCHATAVTESGTPCSRRTASGPPLPTVQASEPCGAAGHMPSKWHSVLMPASQMSSQIELASTCHKRSDATAALELPLPPLPPPPGRQVRTERSPQLTANAPPRG